ncbi:hypothetical protein COO16_03865 [Bacillus pseudomycoides]|uniref:hypothetical protein n=1 Tax=Bacillus pseudomycoides TaxID=64104 RepID=UPI000BEB60F5|nr:hypothetical protein [Bacillus pseudomycoides]PDY14107.1 hypothetical protein COO16_03865 [Bacillus pseudomycoides]
MSENTTKTHNFTIDREEDQDIEETLGLWTKTRRKSQKIRDAIRLLNQVEAGQIVTIPMSAIAQNIPMAYNQVQVPKVPTNTSKHSEEVATIEDVSEESGKMEGTVIESKEVTKQEETTSTEEKLSKNQLRSIMKNR